MCFIGSTRVAGVLTLKSRRIPNPSSDFYCVSHSVMKLEEAKKKKIGLALILSEKLLVEFKSHLSRLNANDYLAN